VDCGGTCTSEGNEACGAGCADCHNSTTSQTCQGGECKCPGNKPVICNGVCQECCGNDDCKEPGKPVCRPDNTCGLPNGP
jgi:hypothetical protein